MSHTQISEQELHAFIDGELPPARLNEVARALALDAELAARAEAFRRDRDALAAAFAPVAAAKLPEAWLRRIEAAVEPGAAIIRPWPLRRTKSRHVVAWAAAACLALVLGVGALQLRMQHHGDVLLQEAEAARNGALPALAHFAGAALPNAQMQNALLSKATGLPVKSPDLRRLGWRLVSLDTYGSGAALHYVNAQAQDLSVYVRRSAGSPRFDILKIGQTRACVWQDEVVGAVMMGEMSAGQMMRVAGAAYADLDL